MNKIVALAKRNYIALFLFVIVIIGSLLRFKGLTFNNHWLDELYSADFSDPARSLGSMLKVTLEDVHPPLYQTILWLWYKIFGFTEYSGRSLSALIGSLSIIVSYLLGNELFDRKIGLYTSLIVSTNIYLINFSQEVRSYELFFLLAMLSYFYFHRTIYNPNKANILLYWLTTALMFYTHYFSLFVVSTQAVVGLTYVCRFTNDRMNLIKTALMTSAVFIVSFVPLLPYILAHIHGEGLSPPAIPPYYPVSYVVAYFGRALALFMLVVSSISLIYLFNRISPKERFGLVLLLTWLALGYFLPYVISLLSSPILSPRYTISLIPAIIIFASFGLSKIRGWASYFLLTVYFVYSLKLLFLGYYDNVNKDQYREVLQEISKYKTIPVYERIPYNGHKGNVTNHYQTYANMLKIKMRIRSDYQLELDIENGDLPECFWAINAHFANFEFNPNFRINDSELSRHHSIRIAKTANFKGAEAILLSYKIEPHICLERISSND